MGIGRTGYGIFGEKINIEKALIACSAVSVVCYLVTVFVTVPVLSLLGCAACGFGVSLLWPGVLSYTSQKYNYNAGPVMFTLLALGGDTGCSLGPWVTGVVSDLYLSMNGGAESQAIRYGLLAAIVFPVVMLILLAVMRKLHNQKG
jgi:fucose permease